MYEEVQTGFFDKNALPFIDSIHHKVSLYQVQNIIPVLMLVVSYQQIKNNALTDSLLTLNADGIFEDVFPRAENPYETHRVTLKSDLLKEKLKIICVINCFSINSIFISSIKIINCEESTSFSNVNFRYWDTNPKFCSSKYNS